MNIIQALIKRQEELGLSDRAFAKELGISHVLWIKTRRGEYAIGPKLGRGIVQRFPELGNDTVSLLTSDLHSRLGVEAVA